MLKPDAFKLILMRNRNVDKYAKYYLLLEKCVKNYTDYQLIIRNHKIIRLEETLHCRTLKLNNKEKNEFLAIFRNNTHEDHPYSVVRGQIKNLNKTLSTLLVNEKDIILNIPCCYANNLYNKIKEILSGHICYQKKYLYLVDGVVLEWSTDPTDMINEYNHVSITRNIGLRDMSLKEFIKTIENIDNSRHEY